MGTDSVDGNTRRKMLRSVVYNIVKNSATKVCLLESHAINGRNGRFFRCLGTGSSNHQSLSAQLRAEEPPSAGVVDPLKHEDFFDVHSLVNLRQLFDARVHLGHKRGCREAKMKPYIFGTRLESDIIDLEQTLPLMQEALNFTAHIAFRQGVILFLSRNQHMLPQIEETAAQAGEFAHCREWYNGTFTNANVQFGAVTRLPDLCIFLGLHNTVFEQHGALVECAKMQIPSIGIADTSCDPEMLSHVVPGNDDSPVAVQLYLDLFKSAILKGKAKRKEMEENGLI